MSDSNGSTRRAFLKSTALSTAAAVLRVPGTQAQFTRTEVETTRRLLVGWEFYRGSLGGIWDVWRKDASTDAIVWDAVQMPHCFNGRDAVDPDTVYYQGPAWYRTRVKIANPFPQGRTLLHFEGAGQRSDIFVSLEKIAEHIGGYDEFVVDITDVTTKIRQDNGDTDLPIAVRCDNSRNLEMIPSSLNDFNRYGGLYRYVNLTYVPAISLERVHVHTIVEASGKAKVNIGARLYNPAALNHDVELAVRVLGPDGSLVHSSSQHLRVWDSEQPVSSFSLDTPHFWTTSTPTLYRCRVTVTSQHGAASVEERFGLRYFEFEQHGPFKLNGQRLLLRGTQRQEDHAGVGAAMPEDLILKELHLIKDMGANFVALAHHQQARIVLDLCDEMGLLVLEEVPWSRGGLGGEAYRDQARNMLRSMIDQHFNHPSVIIWGLGNENDWPGDFQDFDKNQIRSFVKELHDEAHRVDPSRKTLIRRCDFAKDIVDVYSPSLWAGWYHGHYTDYRRKSEEEMEKVDHFLHLEWGGDSHAGRHSEECEAASSVISMRNPKSDVELQSISGTEDAAVYKKGDWSETYICDLFDWHLKEQESMPQLTGTAQCIFKDFATPLRPENPIPFVNQKGLAERDLTLKESYYVFQSYWASSPMVHIYGHSWPIRWGGANEPRVVKVYSNCEEVELFLNGVPQGKKNRNVQDFPATGFRWVVTFKPGKNCLRAIGQRGVAQIVDQCNLEYQTQAWGIPAKLEIREVNRSLTKILVEAQVVDVEGVLCLNARNRVSFGITGDGTLLGDLGSSVGSRLIEARNGRAQIGLLTNRGKSTVSASSRNLATAFLSV